MKYRNLVVNGELITGERLNPLSGQYYRFMGCVSLMKISEAMDVDGSTVVRFWHMQDGLYGCPHYDWSGIRDSSPEAVERMVKFADKWAKEHNHKWSWE